MSVFVVSLFLPYTVEFHDLPTPPPRPSPPLRTRSRADSVEITIDESHEKSSSLDLSKLKASLFADAPGTPRTPAATADTSEFFSQIQPSAATYFVKPHDPRTLVRSDSHVPEWGRNAFFNQPSARIQELPPSRILGYGPQKDELERARKQAKPARLHVSPSGRHHSRTGTAEKRWEKQWNIRPAIQGNGGLANAVRSASSSGSLSHDIIWLGTVGFPTDSLSANIRNEITEKLESEYDAVPVYVSDSDLDGLYSHFCKTILWPVFHYQIPDHPKSKAYEDHSYKFYASVNRAFADKIIRHYKRGDVIWIHDYHLLLVPALVREKLPDAKIGFFLHTAFPSSEVFRCLAMRNPLLEGMLGANLIAFQSKEYCEHFVTTVSRLLRVPATPEGVEMEDHFVNVTSVPIGIDPKSLDELRDAPEVADWINVMRDRYKDKHIIVARDKLDHVRGVRQKLLAFELFLMNNPEWIEKCVLIQVATPATDQEELAATVTDIVSRIDARYSTLAHQPLVFLRQDIAFSQYLALLSVADCLMITSLREGMNLTCHELVVCQDGEKGSKKHAPVILSEFTGSSSLFKGTDLPINPWDYKQTSLAIKQALEMTPEEKERRYREMSKKVYSHTGEQWMNELSTRLDAAFDQRYQRDTKSTPRLSANQLKEKYENATKRVFIMDYEGTLASASEPKNLHLGSPQRVLHALGDLVSDSRNIVYVMSGHKPEDLDRIFERVPELGLIAENGCFYRQHGSTEWKAFVDIEKMKAWKADVKATLKYYQDRMDGSELEERHCSLIFRYRRVQERDREAAARLVADCANHINDACNEQRVHAIHIDKGILIEPMDYSKGSAASHLLEIMEDNGAEQESAMPDFLFVAGDDREDEAIFRWANALGKEKKVQQVTTVSVGTKNTEAMATLTQGTSGLISVLQKLSGTRR